MAERGNGSAGGQAAEESAAASGRPAEDVLDLKARLDRFGELLARGLDLAEAGLSLGLTMLGTIGGAAQTKIIERMVNPGAEEAAVPPGSVAQGGGTAGVAAGAEPAAPSFGITNRLLLKAGGRVRISFSINNESATAEKDVTAVAEAFAGERSGTALPAGALTVTPREARIAPMDFEKFLLEGTIPETAPPDLYRGSVVVLGDGAMRIPVALSVEGGG